jgi:Flp pilus assembly protein TadB
MKRPESTEGNPTEVDPHDESRSAKVAALLKSTLDDTETAKAEKSLLSGVQRKIRQRSRGKFYGDGWSTSQARMSYVLIACVMLVVVGLAYVALGPIGVAPR